MRRAVGQLDLGVTLDDAEVIPQPDRMKAGSEGGEPEKFPDGGQHRPVNLPGGRNAETPDYKAHGHREGNGENDLALPAFTVQPFQLFKPCF